MIFIFTLNSCTDIIKLNLKTEKPRIVIEANLIATDSICVVKVTKTNAFYDNSAPQKVSNLKVLLTKNNKETYKLPEIENSGEYFANNIIAKAGDEFSLQVIDSTNLTYTAKAKMPAKPGHFLIIFNSFSDKDVIMKDSLGNNRIVLFALAYWFDIPNEEDYYRFKIFKGKKYFASSFNLIDDKSAVGDTMQRGLKGPFFKGDTLRFQLLTMNKEAFDYFEQVKEVFNSGNNSTTPYNPKGNFDNNALGYFCTQQIVEEKFIVKKFPYNKKLKLIK